MMNTVHKFAAQYVTAVVDCQKNIYLGNHPPCFYIFVIVYMCIEVRRSVFITVWSCTSQHYEYIFPIYTPVPNISSVSNVDACS